MGEVKIGDYVLVSNCKTARPDNPWYVSFVERILITKKGTYYSVTGSNRAWWKYAKKITRKRGEKIIDTWPLKENFQ